MILGIHVALAKTLGCRGWSCSAVPALITLTNGRSSPQPSTCPAQPPLPLPLPQSLLSSLTSTSTRRQSSRPPQSGTVKILFPAQHAMVLDLHYKSRFLLRTGSWLDSPPRYSSEEKKIISSTISTGRNKAGVWRRLGSPSAAARRPGCLVRDDMTATPVLPRRTTL